MRILIDNGTYELLNLGDVAMLQVAVDRFTALWPDARIVVVTNAPGRLAEFFPNAQPLSPDGRDWWLRRTDLFRPFHRLLSRTKPRFVSFESGLRRRWPRHVLRLAAGRLRRRGHSPDAMNHFVTSVIESDLVVCSGGGYLTDAFAEHAIDVLETLGLAASAGVPTAMLGQGLGPVTQARVEAPLRRVLPRVKRLFLRESRASRPLAVRLGADDAAVAITGDDAVEPAFAARPAESGSAIGINLRTAWYAAVPESALPGLQSALGDLMAEFDARLLPLPVSLHDQGEDGRAIRRLSGQTIEELPDVRTPADLIRRVGACRLVITGSYHAGVFALAQGIPVIGLVQSDYYRGKFDGLAEQFGQGCVSVSLDAPDLHQRLAEQGRRLWDAATDLRGPLLQAAEAQVRAGETAYWSLRPLVQGGRSGHDRPRDRPRVSVLMPVYNGERFIESAVQSILDQTFDDFELIAVDDGSIDGSREKLEAIGRRDARVRVISRPNTGIVGALNDGLAVVRGEYVARMDSDDLAEPQRLLTQVRFLDDRPGVVLVGSRVLLIDANGWPLGDMASVGRNGEEIERALLDGGWPLVHPSVVMRAAALRAIGGYRPGTFPYEDHDLFLRLLDHGRLENIQLPLLQYRRHEQSVVAASKNTRDVLLGVIDATRQRRGDSPIARPPDRPHNPKWSQRRDWAWLALRNGYPRTARKYSWRAVRERPLLKESWTALYCAWRGR